MQHTKRSLKKIPPIEITESWQIHWHASLLTLLINIQAAGQSNWLLLSFLLLYWIASVGIVFIVIHYKHNLMYRISCYFLFLHVHSYIQSLNPILKILKFKYLQIQHKSRNQLATKAQSFPRKSSNTASPMIARHARDFKWNWGCSSNSPPLTRGDQIPHPLEDSDNQIPSSPRRQRCQMPGVCPGGGCWSFDLTDTLCISQFQLWISSERDDFGIFLYRKILASNFWVVWFK